MMRFVDVEKKIETLANVVIIVVALLAAVVLVKNYLLQSPANPAKPIASQPLPEANQIASGTRLSSLDIDWKQNPQTLVLAISSTCHFCTDSAAFYKMLAQNKKDTRLVAVLPQPVAEGKDYLQKLGVTVDEVRQVPLDKIGVRGTPTLLLVDSSGAVQTSWIGKLTGDKENDVLNRLGL